MAMNDSIILFSRTKSMFKTLFIITHWQVTDSDFAIGECNGKTGTLCLSFVDVIEGDLKKQQEAVCDKQEKKRLKFRWWEDESGGEYPVVMAYGQDIVATAALNFM